MQQDSQAAMQQSSTAMALRSEGSQALVLSSAAGGELALLDEADVPRAEHQLRQKVMPSLLTAPPPAFPLPFPPCLHLWPPLGKSGFTTIKQGQGSAAAQAEGDTMRAASEVFALGSPLAVPPPTPTPLPAPPFPSLLC